VIPLYLLYLAVFGVGVLTLASAFLVLFRNPSPLGKFFLLVFAGLTFEMAVTLGVNFVLVVGIPEGGLGFVLVAVGLAVFGMSLTLALATGTYFGFSRVAQTALIGVHTLGWALSVGTSRVGPQLSLSLGWGRYTLFLLPLTILGCLVLFTRHLVRRWSTPRFPRVTVAVALALGWGFLPLFGASVAQVALADPVSLVPGFFPMTPMAVFYLVASLLFLWFQVRPTLVPLPSPGRAPAPDEWASRFGISPREAEVLGLLLEGKDNKQIAYGLGIRAATVKAHLTRLFQKTGTQSRFELVRFIDARNSTKVE